MSEFSAKKFMAELEAEEQQKAKFNAEHQHILDARDKYRAENWKFQFHSVEEILNAPPITFAIEGFLPEKGITMLGGLAGDGKTLVALDMCRTLIEVCPLFGYFKAGAPSKHVIYLVPESGLAPFASRLKLFGLHKHAGTKFFCRTLDPVQMTPYHPHYGPEELVLSDPALQAACKGADVVLDTAIRFMDGNENDSEDQRRFANQLFSLLKAGARTVIGLHHAPKSFSRDNYIGLENALRGSGDLGAMLSACWGLAKIDQKTTSIFVQNVKARDFAPCDAFVIQGRPHIDQTGHFALLDKPGEAGTYNARKPRADGSRASGRPKAQIDVELLKADFKAGLTRRQIAQRQGIPKTTITRKLQELGLVQPGPDEE
ncbi:MAG TPA: AAA family ATPase [Terriglobales bacterium]|nr:AAA family ATPase [Terriglobales bacterium]